MKKRIITSFALIFALFTLGSGVLLYNLLSTTSDLRYLIGLHEIEDIRQDLFFSVQKIQTYVYASGPILPQHLDELIANTKKIDVTIKRCRGCHHEPGVQHEIESTDKLMHFFRAQLRHLISTATAGKHREKEQAEISSLSNNILGQVEAMTKLAKLTIQKKTSQAMDKIDRAYIQLGATLIITLILSLIIAQYLTNSITLPIEALMKSARKIANGKWGYQTKFKTRGEFEELITNFNRMSTSLARKKEETERHLNELRNTQKQLVEAEKLTALGTMAGGIAHDFNNILCGMIGHLHLLKRQLPPDEKHIAILTTVEQAGFRAASLIKQLLAFASQKTLDRQPVDLNKSVEAIVALLENTITKLITIRLDLAPVIPQVDGDPTQLEQVIMNLCINARDAMPEGGELFISTKTIVPDTQFRASHREAHAEKYILLAVKDSGSGIDGKIMPRLFDPFFTTKEVGKGTGLGLAVVYGIIKGHEGFCEIRSSQSKGTVFNIYIPAALENVKKTPPVIVSQKIQVGRSTILVVDDEAIVSSMLVNYLTDIGCKTLLATNGKKAVDILSTQKDNIDLIILDINMPLMGGREAYQKLKDINPDIRVLVSSGYILDGEVQEILNMGAQGFIQKPYKMDDIGAKIHELLKQ